jgi:hypothetical protein
MALSRRRSVPVLPSPAGMGYIKTIYQKLNIRSCSEATLEAVRRGLVRE